jgi:orotate phosphoribosyltransferase
MQAYKRDLIELMVKSGALSFGDFTAKSGRKTPYFVNAGRFRTGEHIAGLARFYASAIVERLGGDFDLLFGPAYKGIPLAVATAMALYEHHGRNVGYCFNRKEAKDHGEGGVLVGQVPKDGDRVVIVEDVTTAGTSIRETVPLLRAAANIELVGLVVAVDRMERGTGERSALQELAAAYSMQAFAIVTVEEIMADLRGRSIDGQTVLTDELYARMQAYRAQYGV